MMDCLYAKCEFNEVTDFGIYLSSFLNAVSLSLRNYDVHYVEIVRFKTFWAQI